jgi:hypothetical protein
VTPSSKCMQYKLTLSPLQIIWMVPMYFRGNMNFMSSITKIMYPGLKYEILTFEMSLFTKQKTKTKWNEKNKTIKCFCHKNVSKLASYLVCTHDIIIHGKRKFIKKHDHCDYSWSKYAAIHNWYLWKLKYRRPPQLSYFFCK